MTHPVLYLPCGSDHIAGGIKITIAPACYVDGSQDLAYHVRDAILDGISSILSLGQALKRAQEAEHHAKQRLSLLTGAQRRVSGPLCVRPDERRGGCWLMGRDADWSSFGLYFVSMQILWEEHPDLRPVSWGEDKLGPVMLVESQPIPETA